MDSILKRDDNSIWARVFCDECNMVLMLVKEDVKVIRIQIKCPYCGHLQEEEE